MNKNVVGGGHFRTEHYKCHFIGKGKFQESFDWAKDNGGTNSFSIMYPTESMAWKNFHSIHH